MQTVDIALFKNACAFTLTLRKFANSRQGSLAAFAAEKGASITDEEGKRMKLRKQLLISPELDAINEHLGDVYKWTTARCMPSFFKAGLYIVKLDQVGNFESYLKGAIADLDLLVTAFVKAYPQQVDEAAKALNGQFNPRDYPRAEEMAGRFGIRWNWIAFGVPENLPAELRAAEAQKLEKQFAEASQEILAALRQGFAEMVEHAIDRLTVAPGEKPKTFKKTLVENWQEFFETFSARNLMNDTQLETLVNKARSVMQGIGTKALREDGSTRERTAKAFQQIQGEMDKLLTELPSRRFALDE